MVKIRFHITETEIVFPDPIVDYLGDGVEAFGVAALDPRFETTEDKEVAMHQLMQESREEKTAIVFRIFEKRLWEND